MKTVKRTISLFLTLTLLCGMLALPVCAATVENTSTSVGNTSYTLNGTTAGSVLYDLGLLKGRGTNPNGTPNLDLNSTASRVDAAVMIVRIIGAEQEALNKHYKHTYTDVPSWADDYVGYASANKIVYGISSTRYDSHTDIPANQFVTLVLRALGYSNVDYKNPFPTAQSIGLACPNTKPFTRSDMAVVCYSALFCKLAGTSQTLCQRLVSNGTIGKAKAFYAEQFKYEGFNATTALTGDYQTNYYPGLDKIPMKQQAIYGTLLTFNMCEFALVEVSNASDVQKVKDIFQARIDAQVGTDGNPGAAWYPAAIEGWRNGSRIVSKGNYVLMVVFPSAADQIVADFNSQF